MRISRIPWCIALVTLVVCGVPEGVQAAQLGPLTLHSYLGQPLNAEIEILGLRPGEEKGLAARVASRAAFRREGVEFNRALFGMRFSIERRAGKRILHLRTNRPIREPILRMLIDLSWNAGRVQSEYDLFLDPPGYRQAKLHARPAPAAPRAAKPKAPTSAPAPSAAAKPSQPPEATEAPALTREALFGVPKTETEAKPEAKRLEWHGYLSNYTAYDYSDPRHWSRGVFRAQVGTEGGSSGIGGGLKWKITARLDVDPVYAESDFYPPAVRKDQRADFSLRETYIDTTAGNFDLRLGKQNIVWGEMVGLFFADVVSARDMRDFILPDFETIRIPQWAARAEYFGDKSHLELIWLPYPSVDDIGKPGAEFYPLQAPPPPGFSQQFNNEVRPARGVRNSNYFAK